VRILTALGYTAFTPRSRLRDMKSPQSTAGGAGMDMKDAAKGRHCPRAGASSPSREIVPRSVV